MKTWPRRSVLFLVACSAAFSGQQFPLGEGLNHPRGKLISPEQILGSSANVQLVANATEITAEIVTVPPQVKNMKWDNGHIKFEEAEVGRWRPTMNLTTELGPVVVSPGIAALLKSLLTTPYIFKEPGIRIAAGYLPMYRFVFKGPERSLEVLIIRHYWSFAVVEDGRFVGGRGPGPQLHELKKELDASFEGTGKFSRRLREYTKW